MQKWSQERYDLKTFGILENWLLRSGVCLSEMDCIYMYYNN